MIQILFKWKRLERTINKYLVLLLEPYKVKLWRKTDTGKLESSLNVTCRFFTDEKLQYKVILNTTGQFPWKNSWTGRIFSSYLPYVAVNWKKK